MQLTKVNEIPLMFPPLNVVNVFDVTVSSQQTHIVERFLHFMILADAKGLVYQKTIDRNLSHVFNMGIDLKHYFESSLPFVPIVNESYPEYHADGIERRAGSACLKLSQVGYEEVFG